MRGMKRSSGRSAMPYCHREFARRVLAENIERGDRGEVERLINKGVELDNDDRIGAVERALLRGDYDIAEIIDWGF